MFQQYGRGVRFVVFYHGGVDTQFWAGHYGSKMSGACVKLRIPKSLPANGSDEEVTDIEENSVSGD